ncbi:hypothetical protein [Methylophaga sulfidovorans]|uniref:Uncharacterized protein n=1 Tax=Methylophaga sulfidovorans TaxID=45496 RepID=A0A1I3XJN7_9GAMM|nr:hypothetical protein [Methylophaga sulfidovorans]SFK19807.1 hypothetical protein SAMN04488079_106111 [Methylophaga sulfidovorans]
MIFLIFTSEGLLEAAPEIQTEKASVWLNPDLKNHIELPNLAAAGCDYYFLPEHADPASEKSVINALSHVEKNSRDNEIYVEYL